MDGMAFTVGVNTDTGFSGVDNSADIADVFIGARYSGDFGTIAGSYIMDDIGATEVDMISAIWRYIK